jgi:hypothetical protein
MLTNPNRRLPQPPPLPFRLLPAAVFADLNLVVRSGSIASACLCILGACVAVAAASIWFEKLDAAVTLITLMCPLFAIPLAFTTDEASDFPMDPIAACQHPTIATYFGADFGDVAAEFSIWTRATYVISLVWFGLSCPFFLGWTVRLLTAGR